VTRAEFDEYVRRFNTEDATAFDDYLAPDMKMLNGGLEFEGVAGMREHYERKIWPHFIEKLNVLRFVGCDDTAAVQLWTRFTARHDADDTLFGPVKKGELFDYRGVIMYEIAKRRFTRITVAYNSFVNTKVSGETINMGMPH
jgi:hypothetical protein